MVEGKAIQLHVPEWERPERVDGTLSQSDFQRDVRALAEICMSGNRRAMPNSRQDLPVRFFASGSVGSGPPVWPVFGFVEGLLGLKGVGDVFRGKTGTPRTIQCE